MSQSFQQKFEEIQIYQHIWANKIAYYSFFSGFRVRYASSLLKKFHPTSQGEKKLKEFCGCKLFTPQKQ